MALKHAVLGLLVTRRGYGYELVQRLDGRLGPAWQLSASTVYAALDQLETAGLVKGLAGCVAGGGRERRGAQRVVNEATEAGREEFEDWLARPILRAEPIRNELALKLAAARRDDAPALLEAIEQAERVTRVTREECEAAAPAAGRRWDDAAATLLGAAAVHRFDADLRWLGRARQAIVELTTGKTPDTDGLTPQSA